MQLGTAPWQIQHKILYHFIDEALNEALRAEVVDGMAVERQQPLAIGGEEPSSVLLLLHEIIKKRHPLMTKRLEFMRASQPQGVELITLISQMETTTELGDIINMTFGDWLTFKAIAGCNEYKLREKLVNTPNPTLEVVKRIANKHLVARNMMASFKKDPLVGAVKAQQSRAPGKPQANTSRRPSPFDEIIKGMRAQCLCLTCGEKQHTGA